MPFSVPKVTADTNKVTTITEYSTWTKTSSELITNISTQVTYYYSDMGKSDTENTYPTSNSALDYTITTVQTETTILTEVFIVTNATWITNLDGSYVYSQIMTVTKTNISSISYFTSYIKVTVIKSDLNGTHIEEEFRNTIFSQIIYIISDT